MNLLLMRKFALVILSFGLLSCAPDKVPKVQAPDTLSKELPAETLVLEYHHEDKSRHDKNLEEVHIGSSIELVGAQGVVLVSAFVKSHCNRPPLEKTFTKTTQFQSVSALKVIDLLPVQALSPLKDASSTLSCRFEMAVTTPTRPPYEVQLKKIKVIGLSDWSNYQPFSNLQLKGQEEFVWSNPLHNKEVQTPMSELLTSLHPDDEVFLLCTEVTSRLDFQTNKTFEILAEHLQAEAPYRETCRLALQSTTDEPALHLSSLFYMNKESKPLSITQTYLYQFSTQDHFANAELASFTYQNPNNFPIFLQLQLPPAHLVKAEIIYNGRGIYQQSSEDRHPIHWTVEGAHEVYDFEEQSQKIVLPAGEAFSIKGHGSLSYNCNTFFPERTNFYNLVKKKGLLFDKSLKGVSLQLCQKIPHSMAYRFEGLPTVTVNLLHSKDRFAKGLPIDHQQTKIHQYNPTEGFSFFKNVSKQHPFCKHLPTSFVPANGKGTSPLKCR